MQAGISTLHRRPTWPLALPVGIAAVAVTLPVLSDSISDRPARLLVGEPFPGGQELLLGLVLLVAARGLLLRRRIAYHLVLGLTVLSLLDALGAGEYGRLFLPAAALVALVRYRAEFTATPTRLRAAVRTGLVTYGVAILYGLVVMVAERNHISPGPSAGDAGREIIDGLTGSGTGPLHFDGSAGHWFESSLGVLGGGGLLATVVALLTAAPAPPAASERERAEAARLVDEDGSDTLAPFVLRSDKSYVFSPDHRAVIGYRVLFGVAVAGGDPAGDPRSYPAAVAAFAALAGRAGWRIAVLGARGDLLDLWRPYGMRSIGIGDEVLLDPGAFGLRGRGMRNVRQAVQRTRRHETPVIVVARAGDGTPVGFQRYLPSAGGRRLSLDAMRRAAGSPNGLNERMIADVMAYAGEHAVREVSLNFAAFRELFDTAERGPLEQGGYRLIHLLDPMIKVESLYLFNRKFRPRYVPRSVLFPSWPGLAAVGAAMLTLEFGHHKPPGGPGTPADEAPVPEDAYPTLPPHTTW